MNKEQLVKRVEKLLYLCEETEPTTAEMMNMDKIFTEDLIATQNHLYNVKDDNYSLSDIVDMMKDCNWIWKKRQKVKEVGWDKYNNIEIVSCEMVIFEWLRKSRTEEFKTISQLIK